MRSFLMIFVCAFMLGAPTGGFAAVKGKSVTYTVGDVQLTGYLAFDDAIKGKRPGVMVVHEWWGHNPYARRRADMLAELGYTAFALDMYGTDKLAEHPGDAKAFMQALFADFPGLKARFLAAKSILEGHETVAKGQVASIGYCMGGGISLHMARAGIDLKGVVSFHGSLGTKSPAKAGSIKAPLLVLNGGADPFVPADQVKGFEAEMAAANAVYELVSYPDAKHSFTNPDADDFGKKFKMPLAYNADADADSWKRMQTFLSSVFSK